MVADARSKPSRSGLTVVMALAALLGLPPLGATAAQSLSGPVAAEVLRVIDGDTIEVRAKIWLDLELTVNARIRGIDAPELRGKCRQETMMAAAATDRLVEVTSGGEVRLTNIEEDKYAGRVVADVTTGDGTELGALMLASGLVRPYDGGARGAWCGLASLGG
jgi:micrococcal nuclease